MFLSCHVRVSKWIHRGLSRVGLSPVAVFQCLYEPLILIDSIYRKGEYYYPKVFLEKYDFIEDM